MLAIRTCLAQDPVPYTDPDTKIEFGTWQQGDMTIGLSLPGDALTTDATEFVGYLVRYTNVDNILHKCTLNVS